MYVHGCSGPVFRRFLCWRRWQGSAHPPREFNLLKVASEKLKQTKQQVREGIAGAPPQ